MCIYILLLIVSKLPKYIHIVVSNFRQRLHVFCDIGVKVNGLPRQVQTCSDGYSRGQTQQTLVWLVISFFTLGRFSMTLYDSVIFWGLGSNQSEQLVILSTNKVWVICRQSDPAIEIQRTFRVGSHQDLTAMLDHHFG